MPAAQEPEAEPERGSGASRPKTFIKLFGPTLLGRKDGGSSTDDTKVHDVEQAQGRGGSSGSAPMAPSASSSQFQRSLLQSLVSEPFEVVYAVEEDGGCRVHNLDSGSIRVVSDASTKLTASFLKGVPTDPSALHRSGRKPWAEYWARRDASEQELREAAQSGQLDAVREVLAAREDGSAPVRLDARGPDGATPLHLACSAGHANVAEALLAAGADAALPGPGGDGALHEASRRGHGACVRLLLQHRADAMHTSREGQLPIHLASMSGHGAVISVLLECGSGQQLHERNPAGALPAEVAASVDALSAFDAAGGGPPADSFARRKPGLPSQGALQRNSRADYVHRLLTKSRQPASVLSEGMTASTTSGEQSPSPSVAGNHTPRRAGTWTTAGSVTPRTTPRRAAGGSTPTHPPFAKVKDTLQTQQVGPASFEIVQVLGKGSFGEVYKVKHKDTDAVYAMKVLQKSKVRSKNLLRYAHSERNILSYIRHPYIVSMYYAFQTSTYLVMVLEFCPKGNLQQLIHRSRRLAEPLAQLYTAEVSLALMHLHERRIVFRDLKPDNVVLDAEQHAKLTDFGLSKEDVGANGAKTFCGSVAFLAPEILMGLEHNHTVDIYDLGVMLFTMLTGLPPFYHNDRETLFANIKYARLDVPRYVSAIAASFIQETMRRDPKRRLGAAGTAELKEHAYFEDLDFERLMRLEVPVPGDVSILGSRGSLDSGRSRRARDSGPFEREAAVTDTGAGAPMVPDWEFASPAHAARRRRAGS